MPSLKIGHVCLLGRAHCVRARVFVGVGLEEGGWESSGRMFTWASACEEHPRVKSISL